MTIITSIKVYPLDIRDCSGDDSRTLMSKGHHSTTAFLVAAREYWGESLYGFDAPSTGWWRAVPDKSGDYKFMYHEAVPHSRGAFPVTVMVAV